jgi:hypothetical protein
MRLRAFHAGRAAAAGAVRGRRLRDHGCVTGARTAGGIRIGGRAGVGAPLTGHQAQRHTGRQAQRHCTHQHQRVGVPVLPVEPVGLDELPEPLLPLPEDPMELEPDDPLGLVLLLEPEPAVPLEPLLPVPLEPLLPEGLDGLVLDEELEPVPAPVPAVPPPCRSHAPSERAAMTVSTAPAVLVRFVFIRNSLKIVRF